MYIDYRKNYNNYYIDNTDFTSLNDGRVIS